MQKRKVFVGLSGGVDSSVAALRLVREGHAVTGIFIKTWHPDFIRCDEERDRLDAMRVAARLDIPFLTFDAVDAYKHHVADYMLREYAAGRTPNPDVMCNTHVKFGAFLEFARAHGADMVATGHYARIDHLSPELPLLRGKDRTKDQSYFLWTLTDEQRAHILFPLGNSIKLEVRKEAAKAGLPTAPKPDSQGVCFLGEIDMKEFLSHYITHEPGAVLDSEGNVIGNHDGALFYTLGERHGFSVDTGGGIGAPMYVIEKNMQKNTVTVSQDRPVLAPGLLTLTDVHRIGTVSWSGLALVAQFRYRHTPVPVSVEFESDDRAMLRTLSAADAPSPGQSCVLYEGDRCVGGGIIA